MHDQRTRRSERHEPLRASVEQETGGAGFLPYPAPGTQISLQNLEYDNL